MKEKCKAVTLRGTKCCDSAKLDGFCMVHHPSRNKFGKLSYKKQRDELIAALKAYQNAGFGNSTDFRLQGEAYDLSVKEIAKCEA